MPIIIRCDECKKEHESKTEALPLEALPPEMQGFPFNIELVPPFWYFTPAKGKLLIACSQRCCEIMAAKDGKAVHFHGPKEPFREDFN